MVRRKQLYPAGLPAANLLPALMTDLEWAAVRAYINTPQLSLSKVAKMTAVPIPQLGILVATVNVEFMANPDLQRQAQFARE